MATVTASNDIGKLLHPPYTFRFRRQNLVKKIDLVKRGGLINFHDSPLWYKVWLSFKPRYNENSQRKMFWKAVLGHFSSWKKWRVLREEKVLVSWKKGPVPEVVTQWCSVKKVFLEISQNSLENTCGRVSFLIKLQAFDFHIWYLSFY